MHNKYSAIFCKLIHQLVNRAIHQYCKNKLHPKNFADSSIGWQQNEPHETPTKPRLLTIQLSDISPCHHSALTKNCNQIEIQSKGICGKKRKDIKLHWYASVALFDFFVCRSVASPTWIRHRTGNGSCSSSGSSSCSGSGSGCGPGRASEE